jgi:hypothetical protein
MSIAIAEHYHRMRVYEIELTADYLAEVEAERELVRAQREAAREEFLPLQFRHGETVPTRSASPATRRSPSPGSPAPNPAGCTRFEAVLRLDTHCEQEYIRHGGIMKYVLRTLLISEENKHRQSERP